jgi:hypothetical protein
MAKLIVRFCILWGEKGPYSFYTIWDSYWTWVEIFEEIFLFINDEGWFFTFKVPGINSCDNSVTINLDYIFQGLVDPVPRL